MSIWRKLSDAGADFVGQLFGAVEDFGAARREVTFTIALIALAAKIAKADGAVTDDEVVAFQDIFELPPDEAENVRRVYRMAMQDVAGFRHYARQIGRMFRNNPAVLEDVLDALFHIALADNEVHPNEADFLEKVA
ncbi:MAG: TerB family tellurite resistance protein, partial [Pseudomonadota bacterium]